MYTTITGYAKEHNYAYRTVKKIINLYHLEPNENGKFLTEDLKKSFKHYYQKSIQKNKEKEKQLKLKEKIVEDGLLSASQMIQSLNIKEETFLRLTRAKNELKGNKINKRIYYTQEQFKLLKEYLTSGKTYDLFYVDYVDGVLLSSLTNKEKYKKEQICQSGRYHYILKKDLFK